MKCNRCGFDDNGTGDFAHVCKPEDFFKTLPHGGQMQVTTDNSATLVNALPDPIRKEIEHLNHCIHNQENVALAQKAEIERLKAANNTIKVEIADVYASNESYRIELERVRGLIKQHLTHHENGCVYLDEALLCKN